jgi:hypothetical protein
MHHEGFQPDVVSARFLRAAVVHAIALRGRNAALEETAMYRNYITNISLKIDTVSFPANLTTKI